MATNRLMEIRVRGKHPVPKALQGLAKRKLEHLPRYLQTITTIDVELYVDGRPKSGRGHVAHVAVLTTGPIFRAKAASTDFTLSLTLVAERLERKLKEFKRRRSGRPAHYRQKVKPADMGDIG
jgi:ribosomal subunit interface protein